MEINEVTVFKLMIFIACIIIITIMVVFLIKVDTHEVKCKDLMQKQDVLSSLVDYTCPEGYYQNYGRFDDVSRSRKCCVKYG